MFWAMNCDFWDLKLYTHNKVIMYPYLNEQYIFNY